MILTPPAMKRVLIQVLTEEVPTAAFALAQTGVFAPDPETLPDGLLPESPGERYRRLHGSARGRLDKVLAHLTPRLAGRPEQVRVIDESQLESLDCWLGDVWVECSKREEAQRRLVEERKLVEQLLQSLHNFASLDIDLGLLQRRRRFLELQVGTVSQVNLHRLSEALGLAGYIVRPFLVAEGNAHLVVAGLRGEGGEVLEDLLATAGFRALPIPSEFRDRPEKVREELSARHRRIVEDLADLDRQAAEHSLRLTGRLQEAQDQVMLSAPYVELGGAVRARGSLAVIGGWAPADRVAALEGHLGDTLASPFGLDAVDPRIEDLPRVPSMLRHPRWLMPFAALVRNYGIPRYGEVDPTWLFAASFVAMFGMMFGDLGQGAVIALGAWLYRRRLAGYAPFAIASGAASMVFGVLYGSLFGYEGVIEPRWLSPLSDPQYMLTLALYWGVGFILIATLLTIANRLAQRRYREALLDSNGLAGLALYGGLIGMAYHAATGSGIAWLDLLAVGLPSAVLLTYKWREAPYAVGERVLVVFMEGFEAVLAYVSNTLSFLRVAAFSLNHVALAVAVFALAGMLGTTGHWVTVVLGNLFILVLEGGIVAIQVLRLEYYEGFSRYFSGDGREFRPLSIYRPRPV